jgi:hypothetical protein
MTTVNKQVKLPGIGHGSTPKKVPEGWQIAAEVNRSGRVVVKARKTPPEKK